MGQDAPIQLERVHHFERPAALDNGVQGGTGGVRNVAREFSSELKANVVLWQKHLPDTLEISRLVVTHPEELGECETGEYRVRSVAQHGVFADGVIYPIHLGLATLITPNKRWAYYVIGCIQNHKTM